MGLATTSPEEGVRPGSGVAGAWAISREESGRPDLGNLGAMLYQESFLQKTGG